MRVIFLKATDLKVVKTKVGTILNLVGKVLEEQLKRGNAKEYTGPWPPRDKVKIKLKDLK